MNFLEDFFASWVCHFLLTPTVFILPILILLSWLGEEEEGDEEAEERPDL